MSRSFGIIALAIFFIWGQGFASGWLVFILTIVEILIVVFNTLPIFQWLIGLFLLGITFFAPPTFGYSEDARIQYRCGYKDGHMGYDLGGIRDTPDDWWEGHEDGASKDISKYKKFYIRGFKRGLAGKKD